MLESLSINGLIDSTPNAAATYARLVRLDYILTNQHFSTTKSAVVSADEKNQNNPILMVSDHEGLEATLNVSSLESSNAQITIVPQSRKARSETINADAAPTSTNQSRTLNAYHKM
ncbi:unnamed protein product [Adineta steineri]|uniref:Uncharacterized protein n=1 Tax=Adineta steineri TaxID=433720 RepID=A0A814TH47_9BILA|nr:unnamed protein product [Adineta steineri]